jgi:hypothetical protein
MSTVVASPRRKRPVLVWLICAGYALGTVLVWVSMYAILSGRVPPPTAAPYPGFHFLVGLALSTVLVLMAMVQLFRLRRSAPYFVTGAFLFGLLAQQLDQNPGSPGHKYAAGEVIGLLIVIYSWRLLKRGILT